MADREKREKDKDTSTERDFLENFKIFLRSTSKAMADREKKRGRRKYKNLNISRTKRAF